MSFMQMRVFEKMPCWLVECNHGETHCVPGHVVTVPDQIKDGATFDRDDVLWPTIEALVKDYVEGRVDGVEVRMLYTGWYTAPGYMDRTEWHWSKNLRELKRELRDAYGD